MKHILTTILFFFCALAYAQNISVIDFRLDEMDLTANQQGTTVLDQNGEKCALIKVKTTQTGFSFDAGSLGISKTLQKTAEIWVYVPHGVRKLSISHQKFGSLDYALPMTTQKAKTYIMELKAEKPLPVNNQRLTIKCMPKNAVVMIDGAMADMQNGIGEMVLTLGAHKYVAMANGYYQGEGTVEVKVDSPARLSIELEAKEPVLKNSASTGTPTPQSQVSNFNAEVQTFNVNGVTFNMMPVEGGTFIMGATPEMRKPFKDELPAHEVTLSSYYMGETEVTQALWLAVMGNNPSKYEGAENPVEKVSWNDCQTFILMLNQATGKKFRLPTEAEWEFAARGGNKSRHTQYSGSDNIDEVAWYAKSKSNTHPVKQKKANELGIYDMTGSVWEWCQDWKGSYSSSPQTNPTGPSSGSFRVCRGGSWYYNARICRSSFRNINTPDRRYNDLGLRLALSE